MLKTETQKRAFEFINRYISPKAKKQATQKAILFVKSEIQRFGWGLKYGILMDCQKNDYRRWKKEFEQILAELKKL